MFKLHCPIRGGLKKNWEKAVRLTAWVDPSSSGQENVKIFTLIFDFGL